MRRVADAPLDLLLRHLLQAQAERDVLVDREVRVERVALEDHGDVAVARRDVVDDPVADPDCALRDVLEAGDHPEGGRLAAARRADEDHELSVLDFQVEPVDGSRAVGIDLRDVLKRNASHALFPLSSWCG